MVLVPRSCQAGSPQSPLSHLFIEVQVPPWSEVRASVWWRPHDGGTRALGDCVRCGRRGWPWILAPASLRFGFDEACLWEFSLERCAL